MTPKLTLNQMIANQMNVNPPVDYTLLNDWVTTTFCTPGYPLAQVAAGITAVLQNFLFRVPYDAYQPLVNRLTGIFLAKLPALLAYQLKIQQVNAGINALSMQQTATENVNETTTRTLDQNTDENNNGSTANSFNPVATNFAPTQPTAQTNQPTQFKDVANAILNNSNRKLTQDTTENVTNTRDYTHWDMSTVNQLQIDAQTYLQGVIRAVDFLFTYLTQTPGGPGWF